jgi:hypothetical protein
MSTVSTDHDVLTVEKLERAMEAVGLARWQRMIAQADAVDVRTTPHLTDIGAAYVLDPNAARLVPWALPGPLLVICHDEDRAKVDEIVRLLRHPEEQS